VRIQFGARLFPLSLELLALTESDQVVCSIVAGNDDARSEATKTNFRAEMNWTKRHYILLAIRFDTHPGEQTEFTELARGQLATCTLVRQGKANS